LPIVLDPLPGEALDSYLGAYARRLHSSEREFLEHVGLPGARASLLAVRLTDRQTDVLSGACGVQPAALRAMTLDMYDGLAVTISARGRLGRAPAWRASGGRTRFCPDCLRRDRGRGPLLWRLPWTFACPDHQVLLADFCPQCEKYPAPWTVNGPGLAASCRRGGLGAWCGSDLTLAPCTALPDDGLVLAAHRHLADMLTAPRHQRPAMLTELAALYSLAWRAVRGLHTVLEHAPPLVHTVLAECGGQLPKTSPADVGGDAHNAAVGTTLALAAHLSGNPAREAMFSWIMEADRTLAGHAENAGAGRRAIRWRAGGPAQVGRVLGALDSQADLPSRLRYATAAARPRWPQLSTEQIQERSRRIPAMLWPGWTLRLLALPTEGTAAARRTDRHAAQFRLGCAAFLLFPGAQPRTSTPQAAALLGNSARQSLRDGVGVLELRMHEHPDQTALARTLAELAYALDEHPVPIDYRRRRALFGTADIGLDPAALRRVCLHVGWTHGSRREALLTWQIRTLLTGQDPPAPVAGDNRWLGSWGDLRFKAPQPVRTFLHREAQRILAEHGIEEPVTWEPDASWAPASSWPGVDPEQVDHTQFIHLLANADGIDTLAQTLKWTREQVLLYCEITDSRSPLPAHGRAVTPQRESLLEPANLRELYEHRGQSLVAIAAQAGCTPKVVRDVLELDGVTIRPQQLPPEKVDREWFEREFLQRHRSIPDLAAERAVSKTYLNGLATKWGYQLRHSQGRRSAIGHLQLDWEPSEALFGIAHGRHAQDRLALLAQLPGRPSFAAAAHAIYGGRESVLRLRVRYIERVVGFEVFDRTATVLTPTAGGRDLIREAVLVLQALDPSWAAPGAATALSDAVTWPQQVHEMRESSDSCLLTCRDHPGHVYTLCFGAPTVITARDYLPGDPARDYPITHYVGWAGTEPSKRIRCHGAYSAKFVAMVQPGTVALEAETKLTGRCSMCAANLWYYAESPSYPGWAPEQIPRILFWPRKAGQPLRLRR
jgi:hypothetical protein